MRGRVAKRRYPASVKYSEEMFNVVFAVSEVNGFSKPNIFRA